MKKKLEEIMKRFENAKTSSDAYEAISDFVQIIINIPEFIDQAEKEADILNGAQRKVNADKGHDLPRREKTEHNKRRDMQGKALHQLNPLFPLRNLHNVHIGIQIENIPDNVDWLYTSFSPDDPMRESDKKEYELFMKKLYKKILPFITTAKKTAPVDVKDLKFKNYDEKTKTLHIGKYPILIAKNKGNNKMHEVMAYIFIDNKDDIKQEFYYAEMAEDRFREVYNTKDKYAHEPYSGACKRINNKIQLETNGKVRKFLDYNTSRLGSVSVNKKYLK